MSRGLIRERLRLRRPGLGELVLAGAYGQRRAVLRLYRAASERCGREPRDLAEARAWALVCERAARLAEVYGAPEIAIVARYDGDVVPLATVPAAPEGPPRRRVAARAVAGGAS